MIDWLLLAIALIGVAVAVLAARKWWIARQLKRRWDSYETPLHLDYYDDIRKRM